MKHTNTITRNSTSVGNETLVRQKFIKIGKGKEKPSLWCVVGNTKARNLYESLGYKQTETITIANKKIN